MNRQRVFGVPGAAVLAAAVLSISTLLPAGAGAQNLVLQGGQVIKVSVSFNTQLPLADLSVAGLAETQKEGRGFLYKLAQDECAVLKASFAETCRLTSLNVSTQIQQGRNQYPASMKINANASFAVGLKPEGIE